MGDNGQFKFSAIMGESGTGMMGGGREGGERGGGGCGCVRRDSISIKDLTLDSPAELCLVGADGVGWISAGRPLQRFIHPDLVLNTLVVYHRLDTVCTNNMTIINLTP